VTSADVNKNMIKLHKYEISILKKSLYTKLAKIAAQMYGPVRPALSRADQQLI